MTAYAAPHRFAHGSMPTAAQLTTYATALDAIHERMGDVLLIPASAHLKVGEDLDHQALRRPGDRYLWVRGDGTLSVPAIPTINDQTITDTDEPTRFDLDALGIPVGAILRVSDSTWIMLTSDP